MERGVRLVIEKMKVRSDERFFYVPLARIASSDSALSIGLQFTLCLSCINLRALIHSSYIPEKKVR